MGSTSPHSLLLQGHRRVRRSYITFGGAAYDRTIALIVAEAPRLGADDVLVYDDRFILDHDFYRVNFDWWHRPDTKYGHANRGFGWFIWKPFVILHALERMQPGDLLLYTDADTYPIADLSVLYEQCVKDGMGALFFAAQGCTHAHWCKRDTLLVMGQDTPHARLDRQHAVARFMVFEAGSWRSKQLLIEWLAYCLNPLANTFDRSRILAEYPELHEPRCEQAILTNLAHKYGYKLYREACQAGMAADEDKDLYQQLFVQLDNATDKTEFSGSKYRNVIA